jgi:hypothetical protein
VASKSASTASVTGIRPDAQHVAAGLRLREGLKQHQLFTSPGRYTHPLKRVGARFERIS